MLDNGTAATDQPDNGTTFIQGQFLDHDTTLDTTPQPTAPTNIKTLDNTRTALLDLDSVYGDGPKGTPELYESDGKHLRVGVSNGVPELPRRTDGSAILGDGRNDENVLQAQFHGAFLRFHNRLVDEGKRFAKAQRLTQQTWQYIILHEYLPRFTGNPPRVPGYNPGNAYDPVLPVEFAVAAFRFGHSQVRSAYRLNTNGPGFQVFTPDDPTDNDLIGGRPVPGNARVEWTRFFNVGGESAAFNRGKLIDTQISDDLFQLQIPGAAPAGSNVLAFRNLVRGKQYGLPSYEDTADALGVTPVDVSAVLAARGVTLPAVFQDETPLWFGVLAESEANGGQKLGPVGGMIVNEVFRTNVERDPNGIVRAPVKGAPVVKTMGDFLHFAGVVGGPF